MQAQDWPVWHTQSLSNGKLQKDVLSRKQLLIHYKAVQQPRTHAI